MEVLSKKQCWFDQRIDVTKSCETLRQAGHMGSGYFFLDGPGGLHYQLVKCNFDLERSDPQFQIATATSLLAEYPVAFECTRDGSYTSHGVISCSYVPVNVGNAMSSSGTFTVPFDGVYLFSISASTESDDVVTRVEIQVDGSAIGGFYLKDGGLKVEHDDDLSGSSQVVIRLNKGQQVNSYLRDGYLTQLTRFVGHLLLAE